MRKIVKAIATVEEFNANLFNKLNIGVEIQDFTKKLNILMFTSF